MNLQLSAPPSNLLRAHIGISGSKSESNRLLLLQAFYPNIKIENLSNSDDAVAMKKGLLKAKGTVDIHHAGTAMRFLTAYFAAQQHKEVILTGSQRMTERPVKVLVEALQSMGAEIAYLGNDGYPPIKIVGRNLSQSKVVLPADISSQYISALLLIAPSLRNGLQLELIGEITSVPYIKMTLGLLAQIGVQTEFKGNKINVKPLKEVASKKLIVESDWSSASYFYSIAALSEIGSQLVLSSFKKDSLQGDSVLQDIYLDFGVETHFDDHHITLTKKAKPVISKVDYNLSNAPDLAQTIAVSCFGLGMSCHLSGLHTLKIKETDRLVALERELGKLGAPISVTDNTLSITGSAAIEMGKTINTYNDHRMAMAFAPLALKTSLTINNAEVVSKSYPDFWNDLKKLQVNIQEV